MKIKITASEQDLKNLYIPPHDALRLAGSTQDAILDGSSWAVKGTEAPNGKECNWYVRREYAHEVKDVSLDLTKPVQTRGGQAARLIGDYTSGGRKYLLFAIREKSGDESLDSTDENGSYFQDGKESRLDIVNAPEPAKEAWVNIYKNAAADIRYNIKSTKEHADKDACPDRIACVKISYREGDGL